MRALVVADIHGNLEAFRAVLAAVEGSGGFDAVWCLGDTVGYGARPVECIKLLREYPHVAVAGNHDLAALDDRLTVDFNPYAAAAVRWTAERLDEELRAWLRGLPQTARVADEFTLVHGSLSDPVWKYLVSPFDALEHLRLQETPYGFVGHSHFQFAMREDGGIATAVRDAEVTLAGARFVANPGSVGQPRDGDPRAAYALVDTDTRNVTFHRVPYDIETTQREIADAGLPEYLAQRLALGR